MKVERINYIVVLKALKEYMNSIFAKSEIKTFELTHEIQTKIVENRYTPKSEIPIHFFSL
ncbi:hypothetical protein KA005_15575 [bacterium]|nr:hypothetical protein [bacterium]